MSTRLYYYTGTGNSLWAARQLAERLAGPVELMSLGSAYGLPDAGCTRIGIVFPVHMWGLPRRVVEFVRQLKPQRDCYFFALAVNAGQVAGTLLQLRKLLAEQQINLDSGFDLPAPSNYIIWNGAPAETKQQELFANVQQKLDSIAAMVRNRQPGPVEKGPVWQNLLFSTIYKIAFPRVPQLDKDFWSDEKCNSCGVCAKICPAGNIRLDEGHPVWLHHCEQCMACLQWCPHEAVQYAKKTAGKKRYRHPAISIPDMLAAAKKNEVHSIAQP